MFKIKTSGYKTQDFFYYLVLECTKSFQKKKHVPGARNVTCVNFKPYLLIEL